MIGSSNDVRGGVTKAGDRRHRQRHVEAERASHNHMPSHRGHVSEWPPAVFGEEGFKGCQERNQSKANARTMEWQCISPCAPRPSSIEISGQEQ